MVNDNLNYLSRAIKPIAKGDLVNSYSRVFRKAFKMRASLNKKSYSPYLFTSHKSEEIISYKDLRGQVFLLDSESYLHAGLLEIVGRLTDVRIMWNWSISHKSLEPFKNIVIYGAPENILTFRKVFDTIYKSIINKWRLDKVNRVYSNRRSEYVLSTLENLSIKNAKLLAEMRKTHKNLWYHDRMEKFIVRTANPNYKAYKTQTKKYKHAISKSFSPNRLIF